METGKALLNWVMYENRQEEPLDTLLTDNLGKIHSRSLPAGSLSEIHINYLHKLANRVLPLSLAEIIHKTKQPFIQAVFDFQLTDYSNASMIFIGDAATTLRPH